MIIRNYQKIDCSEYKDLVDQLKDENPWTETNTYSNIALALFLGLNPREVNVKWPPSGFCIKSSSSETTYPELKERVGGKKFDYYILSVVDTKTKIVYLEGWIDYETLTQEKNLFKNSYIVSFKDLFSMQNLKCQ